MGGGGGVHVQTIPYHILYTHTQPRAWPQLWTLSAFARAQKIIGAAAGYSPSQALGRLETCGKKCAENDASKFDGSATPIHGQPHLLDRLCSLLTTLTTKKYHLEKQTFVPKKQKKNKDGQLLDMGLMCTDKMVLGWGSTLICLTWMNGRIVLLLL